MLLFQLFLVTFTFLTLGCKRIEVTSSKTTLEFIESSTESYGYDSLFGIYQISKLYSSSELTRLVKRKEIHLIRKIESGEVIRGTLDQRNYFIYQLSKNQNLVSNEISDLVSVSIEQNLAKMKSNHMTWYEIMDDVILRAFYCHKISFSKNAFELLIGNGRDQGGYRSTHSLLVLSRLKEKRCVDDSILVPLIEDLAAEILDAQKSENVCCDLFAERVLFLIEAGYGSKIKKTWIKFLENNRNLDGGWPINNSKNRQSRMHATVLSYLAIKRYRNLN